MFEKCKHTYYSFYEIYKTIEKIPELKEHASDFKKMMFSFAECNGDMIYLEYNDILCEEHAENYSESAKIVVRFLKNHIEEEEEDILIQVRW